MKNWEILFGYFFYDYIISIKLKFRFKVFRSNFNEVVFKVVVVFEGNEEVIIFEIFVLVVKFGLLFNMEDGYRRKVWMDVVDMVEELVIYLVINIFCLLNKFGVDEKIVVMVLWLEYLFLLDIF